MTESDADDVMGWLVEIASKGSGVKEHYYALYTVASAAERAVALALERTDLTGVKAVLPLKRGMMNHLGLSPGLVRKR